MKRNRKRKVIQWMCRGVVLLAMLCILSVSSNAQETFGCHMIDTHGQPINGYYSEEDGLWYLFVPSTEEVASLDLYVQGEVTEVSGGALDREGNVVTDPFAESGELTLTCGGEKVRVVVKQSELPSLHIVLADATLDQVHMDKNQKFKGNSVYLSDPKGEHDLVAESSVELKGRGNSTWMFFDKKGYQIKFDDKTSVLGMSKAKKWVLLANASDDSMMRTQLTYRMASQMDMDFVPSFEYIDLWIDGEYRGTYLLGEKIELGSSRLDIQDPMGVLFEHDEGFYQEEDYWFLSAFLGRHFVLKESVEEEDESVILAAMDEFASAVDELMEYLYTTSPADVTLEELSTMIDVDSFIKYYLINEYTLNRESFVSSFYWYKDGAEDVIHLGPIWDFDTCMGNDGVSYTENYGDKHVLFTYLLAVPEFYQRTLELKKDYMPLFAEMSSNTKDLYDEIAESAEINYQRWDVLGKPNPRGGQDFYDTFEDAVSALGAWLEGRETAFDVPESKVVTSVVSDDCGEMSVCFHDDQDYNEIRFAVWSITDGQNDLDWYNAVEDECGIWRYTVDLSRHNSNGIYQIDVYPDDASAAIATGCNYVETARKPSVWIDTAVSEDRTMMELIFQDSENAHTKIDFAVWSAENGQDDVRWYPAVMNETGEWISTVDLTDHNAVGTYHIHAYSERDGISTLAVLRNVYIVEAANDPEVTAEFSSDNTGMTMVLKNAKNTAKQIWFAVWSAENGQDDLHWYTASKDGALWNSEISLAAHASIGAYHIHVYGGTEQPTELLAYTTVNVPAPIRPLPALTAQTVEAERVLNLTLEHAQEYEKVWFPVWTEENGQDDIFWYEGEKQADGTWTCEVKTNVSGIYVIHVYGGEGSPTELLMDRKVTVEVTGQDDSPKLTAGLNGQCLELALEHAEDTQGIWIPVWSEENGQDDIVWYRPEQGADGVWRYTVDLNDHGSNGVYHIHVYQGTDSPAEIIAHTSIEAAGVDKRPTRLSAEVDGDKGAMTIVLVSQEAYEQVWIPVWSEENGQDDLVWYVPERDGTNWTVEVNLKEHSMSGTYFIHAYCGSEAPVDLVAYTAVLAK